MKLIEILNFSIQNSEYYRSKVVQRGDMNIFEFPFLTKNIYNENAKKIVIDKYKDLNINKLMRVRTSGTSGQFTEIYWSRNDYHNSNIHLWRLRQKFYKILPTSKYCSFFSNVYYDELNCNHDILYRIVNKYHISFSKFNLNEKNVKKYCDIIEEFSPNWLFVQPSAILTFIQLVEKCNVKINLKDLKYIECFGEVLLSGAKSKIEEFFNVKVANMYGTIEVNAIGLSCPYGHMHILDKNVYVEILDDDKLAVTSLTNKAAPIIRYILDDKVTIQNDYECKCGMTSDIITKIDGRINQDFLYGGKIINIYQINSIVEYCNEMINNLILQYKIIPEKKLIILYIKPEFTNWKDAVKSEFQNVFFKIMKTDECLDVAIEEYFYFNENNKYKQMNEK